MESFSASLRWLIACDPESAAGNSSGSGKNSSGLSRGPLGLQRLSSTLSGILGERQDSNLRCVQICVPSSSRPLSRSGGQGSRLSQTLKTNCQNIVKLPCILLSCSVRRIRPRQGRLFRGTMGMFRSSMGALLCRRNVGRGLGRCRSS